MTKKSLNPQKDEQKGAIESMQARKNEERKTLRTEESPTYDQQHKALSDKSAILYKIIDIKNGVTTMRVCSGRLTWHPLNEQSLLAGTIRF